MLAAIGMCFFLQSPITAQVNGTLSGTVEDASGKAIPGAQVTLSPRDWAAVYSSTTTTRAGAFLFPTLRPALYDVTVEAPPFATQTLKSVKVHPATLTSLPPIHMTPAGNGPVAETLARDQQAQAPGVEVAFHIDENQVQSLPLPGRDPSYLLETLPGVQTNGRAPLAINGESLSLANFSYEGVNLVQSAAVADSSTILLRTGEVGELAVVTGAIEGCGCAQTAFTAPAGSNAFHGSAYALEIPNGLASQYWTDNSQHTPASTNITQPGATFGGPLRKNRLFFFANYEADLNSSTITRTGQVPTSPLSSEDPLMRRVLALIPSDPSGTYRGTQNNGGAGSVGMARLDYLLSPRQSFGLTFAGSTRSTDDPTDSSVFGRQPTTTLGASALFVAGSWRWSPTPRLTNELRAGADLSDLDYRNSLRSQFDFIAILSNPNVPVSQPMMGIDPEQRKNHLHSYQDNLTWVAGKHTIQAGLLFQQFSLESDGFNDGPLDSLTVPRYTVNDIVQGTISETDQRFNIASPTSGYSSASPAHSILAAHMISPYLEDTWKPVRSLAITLGLRYDYLSPADEQTGSAIIPVLSGVPANAVFNKQLTFAFASAGHPFYEKDTDNYGPYIGLAWKPLRNFPLMVRGGTSLSYFNDDLLPNMSIYALENPFQSFDVATGFSTPVALSQAPVTPVPTLPGLTLPALLSFANSFNQEPGPVYAVDPAVRTPNVKYWNLGVESQAKGLLFGVRYLGNRLEEGPRSPDREQATMTPAFLAAFQQVQSALINGTPTQGIPQLPGGGICANFSLQNCQPDVYARSLILSGQAGELGRWLVGQGYSTNGVYNFLGNPLAPQGIYLLSSIGISRYDALEATVSRPLNRGLSLSASYVLSKVMSDLDDYRLGAIDPYLNLYTPSNEWAPSPFNVTNVFKVISSWDLPFSNKFLRGWSVSGIAIAQSGAPFSLLSGGYVTIPNGNVVAVSGLGTFTLLADSGENTVATSLNAGQIRSYFGIRENGDGTLTYVNAPAGAFQEPGPGDVGNLQRRMFTGPGAFNLNLGVRRTLALTERTSAEFRAESINTLNNVNWLVGDQAYMGTNNQKSASTFDGSITQWNSPRTIQFLVRVSF